MSVGIRISVNRTEDADDGAEHSRRVEESSIRPRKAKTLADNQVYIPGDTVQENAEGWMDGHGSYCAVLPDKRVQILSSVAGVKQIFTKVVVINPLRSRYMGEIGDIVVGRIIRVGRKAWTVNVGAQRHAILSLGAINLPTGELRRKTEADIDFMRGYLKEGDLVSAEVQKTGHDGQLLLHTRSLRYGRLAEGTLVHVMPKLTKRGKGHFVSYETFGVSLIIAVNGAIWIAPITQHQNLNTPLGLDQGEQVRKVNLRNYPDQEEMYVGLTEAAASKLDAKLDDGGKITVEPKTSIASLNVRKCIARIRNCIEILNEHQVPIHRETIRILYDVSMKYDPKDLLEPSVAQEVFSGAKQELLQELAGSEQLVS